MEAQAVNLLSTLKRPAAPSDTKLTLLNTLKSDIKHYRVPESAQATIFDCLKLAITQQASSTLASSAFSTLSHLIKRLKIQDASATAITHLAPRLFPALQDRLGDQREPMRTGAAQALTELYPFLGQDVENIVRDEAIGGSNPRAKEAGMQWVVRMHEEEAMPFKGYVSSMVARLEDADGSVREAAKNALIQLFKNAPDRAKTDLKRQLKAHSVRHQIETYIVAQIGATTASRPPMAKESEPDADLAASTRSLPASAAHWSDSINSESAQPPPQEPVQMDPMYVHSQRELEDAFRDMLPHFEGKEDEHNWMLRDKDVLKIRRLLTGNAPNEYHQAFMAGIKSVIDGVLKVANSLRTTPSSNGCQLIQELARMLGPALDPHVEVILQSFIKMCANTKLIAAANGRVTTDAIFQNCSYNVRQMQHIWSAAQEKNAAVRQCVPEWLKTILRRQAGYKHHFETSGGLDLAEKCLRKGLDDANPKVKEGMRATYWTFAKTWPEKADAIMSKLDPKSKTALERDSHNPNAALFASQSGSAAPASRPGGSASRLGLREAIAEQRKAKAAGRLPDRPGSAMAALSPAKPRSQASSSNIRGQSHLRSENRTASSTSTTETPSDSKGAAKKGNSLMSGPVRRPRRPEIQRPQTADPYASKRLLRPETPADGSPGASSPKSTAGSKASVPTSSAIRNRAKTAVNTTSPSGSPVKRSPMALSHAHPVADSSRPTSKSSAATCEDVTHAQDDDFTMVMPQGKGVVVANGRAIAHKRPALGQTASVDSGMPIVAEDDGFTMVIPTLQVSNPRARSPLAYRSPLKAMFDEARDRLEHSGASPPREHLNGIDEALEVGSSSVRRPNSARSAATTPQPEEIQIYEDPFAATDAISTPLEEGEEGNRRALGELPVNENVRVQSPAQSQGSSASPAGSPTHRAPPGTTAATNNSTTQQQPPQDRAEVLRSRRLLTSGIERIRSKTLDAHGFRRVQDIAKSDLDVWGSSGNVNGGGGSKYDELMAALLDYLRTFEQIQLPPHKSAGLKAQALGLVRALLTLRRKDAVAWHAKALVTLYVCRQGVEGSSSYILTDMERTVADIIAQQSGTHKIDGCVDATLDYLSPSPSPSPSTAPSAKSCAMALTTLRRLLYSTKMDLGPERKVRIAQTAARFLDDGDAEVRKADVELASELFELFGSSKGEFWGEFRGTDEGRLGLLTYYIARRGREGGGG